MFDFYAFCVLANILAFVCTQVIVKLFITHDAEDVRKFGDCFKGYLRDNPESSNRLVFLKLFSWSIPAYTVCTSIVYFWCLWKYPKDIRFVVALLKTYTFGFNALPKGFKYNLFYDIEKKEYVLKYGSAINVSDD